MREAVILDQRKETTFKLQAIRIGDLSISTLPNEVYCDHGVEAAGMVSVQAPFQH